MTQSIDREMDSLNTREPEYEWAHPLTRKVIDLYALVVLKGVSLTKEYLFKRLGDTKELTRVLNDPHEQEYLSFYGVEIE